MNSRVNQITSVLKKTYPSAKVVLKYGNNWELLVSVILSAQCTDKKVNEVTARLFTKYRAMKPSSRAQRGGLASARLPRPPLRGGLAMTNSLERQEIEKFATVPIEELEKDIRATGFYRNKAKNIRGAAKMILEKFGGKLPRTMAEMVTIPGVARKTANVVLGNAYGVVDGIAVDTHVLRLSQRLRLVALDKIGGGNKPLYYTKVRERRLDYYKDASSEKIEQALMKVIPKEDWFKLTYLLIDHGRAICKAQKPDCRSCQLNKLCPAARI